MPDGTIRGIVENCGKIGIRKASDAARLGELRMREITNKVDRIRGISLEAKRETKTFLLKIGRGEAEQERRWRTNCWRWADDMARLNHFCISNARRYQMLRQKENACPRLNRIWGYTKSEKEWNKLWHSVWSSDLSLKAKTFIWRVLAQGLFSGTRALKIGKGNGLCILCSTQESIPHIFFDCCHAKMCWRRSAEGFGNLLDWPWRLPLDICDLLAGKTLRHTIRAYLFYHSLWAIWLGRNNQTFNPGSSRIFDFVSLLFEMTDHILGAIERTPPGRKKTRLLRAKEETIKERMKWLTRTDARLLSPP